MVYNWNLLSVTSFDRLCHFWDTLLVDEVWSATRQRSRTSNHGRYLIVSRAYASSWDLWLTPGALFRILLTLRRLWWPWLERTIHLCGTRVVRLPSVFSRRHLYMPRAFPTETGQYIIDTDASNFGLGGVLSQIQDDVEHVVAYCSHSLRPSQRRYCTTKCEMLAAVAMCIQFRSYLRGAKFILRTDHKSLVWLHRFKDTEGMMARWLHALQLFQFSIIHRPGRDHGNADGLSRVPASPCRQCTWPDCSPVVESIDQPFDSESIGSSEDGWLDPHPLGRRLGGSTRWWLISTDSYCWWIFSYFDAWISSGEFPSRTEVKGLHPELRSLWHHRNNLSLDDNGIIWRKRSSQSSLLQLLVPKSGREQLFLAYHASLFGGHLGRNRALACLAHRFYWSGMSDDAKEWLTQCVACVKRKSPVGRHHPLGNIPTGHRWDRIAMDILDVCDPTSDGHHYILVIADYFSKWTEAFPMKNKCADTVADLLVDNIILRFGMPLVIHSDQVGSLRIDL